MTAQFYNLDERLAVASDEDNAAVWSDDNAEWRKGDVSFARLVLMEGEKITAAQARADWPAADLDNLPEFPASE